MVQVQPMMALPRRGVCLGIRVCTANSCGDQARQRVRGSPYRMDGRPFGEVPVARTNGGPVIDPRSVLVRAPLVLKPTPPRNESRYFSVRDAAGDRGGERRIYETPLRSAPPRRA